MEFQIGQEVKHKSNPHGLFCGSGTFPYAIVVSVTPFVMASSQGDMLWTCQKPDDFIPTGNKADPLEVYSAVGRYAFELGLPQKAWKQ